MLLTGRISLAVVISSILFGIPSSARPLAPIDQNPNPNVIKPVDYPPSTGGRDLATVIMPDHKVLNRRAPLPDPRRKDAERLVTDMDTHKKLLNAGEYGDAAQAATRLHATDYGEPDHRLIAEAAKVARETGTDVTVEEIENVVGGKRW